ncbi:MAG: TonB family protein [Pyrinomonadaceae bacterium]
MFRNLVESGSHRQDLQRKGRFFFATLSAYALCLAGAGVASVFAYDEHLENQNLELVTLFTPAAPEMPVEVQRENLRTTTASDSKDQIDIRTQAYNKLENTTQPPQHISTSRNTVPPVPSFERFKLGDTNLIVSTPGTPDATDSRSNNSLTANGNLKLPPPPQPPAMNRTTQPPATQPAVRRVSGRVLEGKATFKPAPVYPEAAKAARVEGAVTVQILVDETGRVVSVQAALGHPLLRQTAIQAALRARFTPTLLTGQPVKISGIITYNFVLQ